MGKRPFQNLLIKLGCRHRALGMCVDLWTLAQENWFPDRNLIPEEAFREAQLSETLIEVGLAERRAEGIYAKGTKEAFAWLFQCAEAGKHSGESRRKKGGKKKTNDRSTAVNEPSTTVEVGSTTVEVPQPLYSSFSSLPSSLENHKNKKEESKGELTAQAPPLAHVQSPVAYFIASYVKAFQARYGPGCRPDLRGKVQGLVKTFVSEHPLERAVALIQVYCQLDGGRDWFKTKSHDFVTFIENLNQVSIALDTGRDPAKPKPFSITEIIEQEKREKEITSRVSA